MINIRIGMYETNSSSCHVFGFKPDSNISVPKTVTLIPDNEDTILNTLFNDIYCWYSPGKYGEEEVANFISSLFELGVDTIKCSDKSVENIANEVKNGTAKTNPFGWRCNKEMLRQILFGEDVKLTVMEDYEISQEAVEQEFGKGYKFYSIRLS